MAILGRTYVLPIIVRSDTADFATTQNPVTTVVVAAPYASTWFKGPQATITQSQTADFATEKNPVTVVTAAAPYARVWFNGQQATISQSQSADFQDTAVPNGYVVTPINKPQLVSPTIIVRNPQDQATPAASTPGPVVVVPASTRPTFTLPIQSRTSFEDTKGTQPVISANSTRPQAVPAVLSRTPLEVPKGTQPLVVTSPQRPGLATPAILTRSNPATFIVTPVPPPLVYTPIVPKVWFRGYTSVYFPRGDFTPAPPPPGPMPVFCALDPIITWYASSPVTDWFAGGPVTGWQAAEPEEECC